MIPLLRVARLTCARGRRPWRRVVRRAARRLARDDRGGEVLEYALIAGLLIVGAIAVITAVGSKVQARWNALNNGL